MSASSNSLWSIHCVYFRNQQLLISKTLTDDTVPCGWHFPSAAAEQLMAHVLAVGLLGWLCWSQQRRRAEGMLGEMETFKTWMESKRNHKKGTQNPDAGITRMLPEALLALEKEPMVCGLLFQFHLFDFSTLAQAHPVPVPNHKLRIRFICSPEPPTPEEQLCPPSSLQ